MSLDGRLVKLINIIIMSLLSLYFSLAGQHACALYSCDTSPMIDSFACVLILAPECCDLMIILLELLPHDALTT